MARNPFQTQEDFMGHLITEIDYLNRKAASCPDVSKQQVSTMTTAMAVKLMLEDVGKADTKEFVDALIDNWLALRPEFSTN